MPRKQSPLSGIRLTMPFPIRTSLRPKPKSGWTLGRTKRRSLFFGNIRPYKGIEYLLAAFQLARGQRADYRLIIAGEPKKGSESIGRDPAKRLGRNSRGQIILKIEFIPDEETELYLKAADVLVLPYKDIFQSGVLFLGYSFGLPVVATDVGSFREEIVEGRRAFYASPAIRRNWPKLSRSTLPAICIRTEIPPTRDKRLR